MNPIKTELWSRIVGKWVECHIADVSEASKSAAADGVGRDDGLGDYLAVYTTELGADVRTVDVRKAVDAAEVLALLAARLNFPDYFGENLDALYDVTGEYADRLQAQLNAQDGSVPQVWLIHSDVAQSKMLFPVMDTLKDAMSELTGVGLSILWVVTGANTV
jgi:hypothetical protein